MKALLEKLIVWVADTIYQNVIRPDLCFCDHGYIATTCSHCWRGP